MIGKNLNHYRIIEKLGEGGMGVVYKSWDERLERHVALKLIRNDQLNELAKRRLWREARMAAAISHPHICQLYEIGEAGGHLFIAMELVEGVTLSDRLQEGPVPIPESLPLILQLLDAVGTMHRQGLVHRDLKPSNLKLTSSGVKLLDFGLARRTGPAGNETETALTQPGTIVGTLHYMAPEAIAGQPAEAPADLFAIGAILYELLTGKRAFHGESVPALLRAVMYDMPPALGGTPTIRAVDRVIRRALAKKPEGRLATAEEFIGALRAIHLAGDGSSQQVAARAIRRLIVLPFRALRTDSETEFLAVSLPDAITASLSGLQSLVVRSSVVAARFAGATPDLERLAAEADVDAVLTGTLMRHGEEIRASVQLVQAPEGTLIDSCTEQVRIRDLFQLQDDLTRRIVESLRIGVTQGDERKLTQDVPKSPDAYRWFLRANLLSGNRQNAAEARNLYLQCVQEDSAYAPAWARLGRCYRIIAKYNEEPEANLRRAQSAFDRALSLNPELDVAHSQYALLESDLGRPRHAMVRLLERAAKNPNSAELYAGLVYTCRFCGLMKESVWFHEEARRLDRNIPTSVVQTYFQQGDYLKCLETSPGDIGYIDAVALDAIGRRAEAVSRLQQRIGAGSMVPMARLYVGSLLALLEGRREESLSLTLEACDQFYMGPEETLYMARQMIYLGDLDQGLRRLKQAVKLGYSYPSWLASDPWFESARRSPEFASLLALAEAEHEEALQVFSSAHGNELLGRAALRQPVSEATETFTIPVSRPE